MAELTVPSLDFSSIGQLPQVYRQAQADQLRKQTLASLGQGGTADAQALLKSGDLSLAQLGIGLQNTEYQHGRDSKNDTRQAAQDALNQQHWQASYALQKAANDRAGEDKFIIKDVTDPNGNTSFVKINPRTGEVLPTGNAAPATAPNNPYAYGKQNEAQSKDSGYANRMFDAEQTLRDPKVIEAGTSIKQAGIEGIPLIPDAAKNWAHSPEYQKYDQAQRNMINSILRRESGAAISQSEFDNAYKQYIPRVGDSPEKLAEKQRNRQAAIAGIAGGGGQSYKPPYVFGPNGEMVPTGAPAQGATAAAPQAAPASPPLPKTGQLIQGYRYKGGNPADPNSWVKAQ